MKNFLIKKFKVEAIGLYFQNQKISFQKWRNMKLL